MSFRPNLSLKFLKITLYNKYMFRIFGFSMIYLGTSYLVSNFKTLVMKILNLMHFLLQNNL